MLNTNGKRGYLYLVHNLWGKAFIFSPLSMTLVVDLSYIVFNILRCISSVLNLIVFIIKGHCILSTSTEKIDFFPFILLMWYHIFWFVCVGTRLLPRDNSYLVILIDDSNVLLNLVFNILLEIFASIFIRDISL